jgi:hypothetical protein
MEHLPSNDKDPLAGLTVLNTEQWHDDNDNLSTFVLNFTNGDRYSIELEDGEMTIGYEGRRPTDPNTEPLQAFANEQWDHPTQPS